MPNLRPKSINCFKSFPTITSLQPLLRWVGLAHLASPSAFHGAWLADIPRVPLMATGQVDILCGELTDRMAADFALFKRRPRTLTLQHRSALRPDHLQVESAPGHARLSPLAASPQWCCLRPSPLSNSRSGLWPLDSFQAALEGRSYGRSDQHAIALHVPATVAGLPHPRM